MTLLSGAEVKWTPDRRHEAVTPPNQEPYIKSCDAAEYGSFGEMTSRKGSLTGQKKVEI